MEVHVGLGGGYAVIRCGENGCGVQDWNGVYYEQEDLITSAMSYVHYFDQPFTVQVFSTFPPGDYKRFEYVDQRIESIWAH